MIHAHDEAGARAPDMPRRRSLEFLLGGALAVLGLARPAAADDSDGLFPAWFKQSFMDLRLDLAEAGAAGKQGIMVLFHIHGCPYCKRLVERSLREPGNEAHLRRHFDVIALDIHSPAEIKDAQGRALTVREFAAREGMSFSPSVAFYGLAGQNLTRVVGFQSAERFRVTLDQALGARPPARAAGASGEKGPQRPD